MADRSIRLRLQAEVAGYVAGLKNAAQATRDLTGEVLQEASDNEQAWTDVGTTLVAFGGTAGVAFGLAVNAAAEFEHQMSAVKAATGANVEEMQLLGDAAIDAGSRTVFSATEAAQAQEELAKAGVSVRDILQGGLDGALSLAAAGSLEVADAASIAATAMTQFGLDGGQMTHVADLLAAGAGKAQGDVSDLGMALGQVGLVADQSGLSIEETTAGLAAFAAQGLIGSDAGTSFKSMLQRLTPQSQEAADEMARLGFSAYDSQGDFIGLQGVAGELRTSLAGLTVEQRNAALGTIFGSDAIRAAAVLDDQGAEGVAEWTQKVNDQGYAAETAATKLDNLQGDLEALGGAFDTALIKSGSTATGVLRELTQAATFAVNAYASMPTPVQAGVTAIAGISAVTATAAGAFFLAVPKIAAFKEGLANMGPRTQAVAGHLGTLATTLRGPVAIALTVGAAALFAHSKNQAAATERTQEFTAALQADSGVLGQNTRATAANLLEKARVLELGAKLGLSERTLTDAALGNAAAIEQVSAAYRENGDALKDGFDAKDFLGGLKDTTEGLESAQGAYERTEQAIGPAAEATGELAEAQSASARVAQELADEQAGLNAELRDQADLVLALSGAQISYEEAVDRAAQAAAENGRTLDITTEAGQQNARARDAMTESALRELAALEASNAPQSEYNARLGVMREQLYNALRAFGETEESARSYTDRLLGIPRDILTTPRFDDSEAYRKAERLKDYYAGLDLRATVRVDQVLGTVVNKGTGGLGGLTEKADGGWIRGPGGPRDDLVPMMGSNGEFVVNARDAAVHGPLLEAINNGRGEQYVRGTTTVVALPAPAPAAAAAAAPASLVVRFRDGGVGLLEQLVEVAIDRRDDGFATELAYRGG